MMPDFSFLVFPTSLSSTDSNLILHLYFFEKRILPAKGKVQWNRHVEECMGMKRNTCTYHSYEIAHNIFIAPTVQFSVYCAPIPRRRTRLSVVPFHAYIKINT
ncbi:hypothetical protein RB195_013607 [Necator americanus]|uniref:Uncharacterized protein n=1 Tax=Necator americanus TaxID=51031 RepID=A0ABR1DWD4_NECAM